MNFLKVSLDRRQNRSGLPAKAPAKAPAKKAPAKAKAPAKRPARTTRKKAVKAE